MSEEYKRGFDAGARRVATMALVLREKEEQADKHRVPHNGFKTALEGWLYQILATEGTMTRGSEDTMSEKVESVVVSEQEVGKVIASEVVAVAETVVGLTFGAALELAKKGKRIARAGWNGKGMWVTYSPGHTALPAANFWAAANKEFAYQRGGACEVLPCMTMKTADHKILMGWLASQSDMLAADWEVVP